MYPTFRVGDFLHLTAVKVEQIRCGDVVVFSADGDSRMVAHRVVSRTDCGFVTMGDNNVSPDSHLLTSAAIVGRVFQAENNGKVRRISGGIRGRVRGTTVRMIFGAKRKSFAALKPIYKLLAESVSFRGLGDSIFETRVALFNRPGHDTEFQLLWKNRVIGRFTSDNNKWIIKKPFDLFIDEKKLPGSL